MRLVFVTLFAVAYLGLLAPGEVNHNDCPLQKSKTLLFTVIYWFSLYLVQKFKVFEEENRFFYLNFLFCSRAAGSSIINCPTLPPSYTPHLIYLVSNLFLRFMMLHTIFLVLTDEIENLVVSKLCFPEGLSFADHSLLIAVFQPWTMDCLSLQLTDGTV